MISKILDTKIKTNNLPANTLLDFKSNALANRWLAKQISLHSLMPSQLNEVRTLLKGGDLPQAVEKMGLVVTGVKEASSIPLVPSSAAAEFRLLRCEVNDALKKAGLEIASLSPITIGIDDASFDLGYHGRYYDLSQLQRMISSLLEPTQSRAVVC